MAIRRVLIANRGEIAVRIIRACQTLGLETVAPVSEADRDSLAARMADRAVCIGPAMASGSYLNVGALTAAARGAGADSLHPGYGFLAESAELADACERFGITFVNARAEHLRQMGNKLEARELVRNFGIPTLPGSKKVASLEQAQAAAEQIGFPVLFKVAAGGGGRGIKVVTEPAGLRHAFQTAAAEARAAFGDETLYLERYLANARHVEVQVLGDRVGNTVHVGERDCTLQRRYQKLVEEAPAAHVAAPAREQLRQAGATIAAKLRYESAGT
ncbi:MAG TPA: biotin carboxylase N-terminal domain-containing protein, partial [Chloroflexota bacterium]|nr:biotin carboxylase N-terminal domain-containing protein [Chloroflexota bacterium]